MKLSDITFVTGAEEVADTFHEERRYDFAHLERLHYILKYVMQTEVVYNAHFGLLLVELSKLESKSLTRN